LARRRPMTRYTKTLPVSDLAKCPDDATHAPEPFDVYRASFCRTKAYTNSVCVRPDSGHQYRPIL
ncbi:11323_t:CDS:1, partial [Ambispora gerdemannii]